LAISLYVLIGKQPRVLPHWYQESRGSIFQEDAMKSALCLIGLLVICTTTPEVRAGGPPPVCMAVERLVFEPNENTPTRIQIWGSFALLNSTRDAYGEPVRGYLYYTAAPGKEEESRKKWGELKKLVAEQHLVSYGICGEPKVDGHLRKPTDKAEAPVEFPFDKAGFANADKMCTSYPSLKPLLKLSESHRSGGATTKSARGADRQGK
jgi:hypothetical protein